MMRKVVQKTKYGTFFLWNMSDVVLFVDDFLQIPGKCIILFPRAFGRPFRGLAGIAIKIKEQHPQKMLLLVRPGGFEPLAFGVGEL